MLSVPRGATQPDASPAIFLACLCGGQFPGNAFQTQCDMPMLQAPRWRAIGQGGRLFGRTLTMIEQRDPPGGFMSTTSGPPFRAEHIGSLLRPPELLRARERQAGGALDRQALTAIEERAIRDVVK